MLLGGIVWTLDATFCPINDAIHRQTQGERLLKVLRVSGGQCLGFAECHVQDYTECMNPFIDPTLTGLKEERQDLLERVDFKIQENKQEFIFHSSEVGFPPTTIASLAGFLDDVLVIPVGMVGHCKVGQEFFKLCLIQACKGTECT